MFFLPLFVFSLCPCVFVDPSKNATLCLCAVCAAGRGREQSTDYAPLEENKKTKTGPHLLPVSFKRPRPRASAPAPQTMGRLFLETLSEGDAGAVYTCACGAEVASASALVWEVRRERIGDASPRVAHPSPGTIVSCQ